MLTAPPDGKSGGPMQVVQAVGLQRIKQGPETEVPDSWAACDHDAPVSLVNVV